MSQPVSQRAKELMAMLDAANAEPDPVKQDQMRRAFRDELWKNYRKQPAVKDWAKAAAGDEQ